jgi:hypothetical protein
VLLLGAASWQNVARQLSLPRLHSRDVLPGSFWARNDVHRNLALAAGQSSAAVNWHPRRTYPYSVIPGGVRDARELREVAARDYVVRNHFKNFNYERAELIRSRQSRLVYMSYRRWNKISWTRKKVRLPADELLLTDGVITARARCGNQISEQPQSEVASDEPPESVLDLPVPEVEGQRGLPLLLARSTPSLPINAPPPAGTAIFGAFGFPFVPFGGSAGAPRRPQVCETHAQEIWERSHSIGGDHEADEDHCHKHKHLATPEPSTLLLISSGFLGILWGYWRVGVQS